MKTINNLRFLCNCLLLIFCFISVNSVYSEIIYLNGGEMLKGKIESRSKNEVKVKISYGVIGINTADISKITDDTNPTGLYDLAKYYMSREDYNQAVEEFDNLLLVKPDMKNKVLDYLSDINFNKSPKQRMNRLESVAKAYKMIEEGRVLVNLGSKQLKYDTKFNDPDWQKKVQAIAQKNVAQGEGLIKKGQAIVDAYHAEKEAEIQRAREKAQQEKGNKSNVR